MTYLSLKHNGQMSEAFLTAAFLSVSGGLQDAYTYIARGNVFANAQTGNIVLMNANLYDRNWSAAFQYFVPLLAFALGVAAADVIRNIYKELSAIHWRQLIVLLEMVLLFAVGFMPDSLNALANAMVSFACAMQVQAFRKVNSYAFASTMCIGNMRSGMEALCVYFRTREQKTLHKALHYFGIIFLFGLGAGFGSHLILTFGLHAIWFSCLFLAVSFCLMFIKEEGD